MVATVDAITGGAKFNIVVGSGSYTAGTLPPIDNSQLYGYPTNLAIAGDALFNTDVPFTTDEFPGPLVGAQGQVINQGNVIITAATGGSTVLVPTNYDAAI